ncbi:unnamed protein product [Hydatigera taeniaeformis]|uniref:Uncharacterized protein n=1 Tax=Hydatigena taeniaeformis TaxID=6205 RepID=A0A0R3X281_HYDTA|nr:unnamed protein product [Hydatigera taeniaeformis]
MTEDANTNAAATDDYLPLRITVISKGPLTHHNSNNNSTGHHCRRREEVSGTGEGGKEIERWCGARDSRSRVIAHAF